MRASSIRSGSREEWQLHRRKRQSRSDRPTRIGVVGAGMFKRTTTIAAVAPSTMSSAAFGTGGRVLEQ